MTEILIRAGAIILLALLLQRIRKRVVIRHFAKLSRVDAGRSEALKQIAQNVLSWCIWLVAGVTLLDTSGVDIGALVAALGVIGLAISFGAQSFIKDIISYAVYIFADNFRIGEDVSMDGKRGEVRKFEMRGVVLLCTSETEEPWIAYVPYSRITTIENYSRDITDA